MQKLTSRRQFREDEKRHHPFEIWYLEFFILWVKLHRKIQNINLPLLSAIILHFYFFSCYWIKFGNVYTRIRGLPLRVLRISLFLGQADWELKCFTLLLRECGKVRDHTALKCQLSGSLKFSIWIPVYNPYTGCINRTHIIPSKLSRRSDKGKSIQVYCPGLLSFTTFPSANSRSLKQWATYLYLSSECKASIFSHIQAKCSHFE